MLPSSSPSTSPTLKDKLSQIKQLRDTTSNSLAEIEAQTELLIEKEKFIAEKEKELALRETTLSQSEMKILQIEEKISKSTIVSSRLKKNQVVTLNVGGTKFETTLATILSEKNTFFTGYFSDQFAPTPEEKDNAFFIDRPSSQFGLILDHLRGLNIENRIWAMNDKNLFEFIEEVVYYQLTSIYALLPQKGRKMLINNFGVALDSSIYGVKFDPRYCSTRFNITNENRRVKKIADDKNWNAIAFGNQIVEEYSIKIISNCRDMMFGFAPRHSNVNSDTLCWKVTNGYYIYSANGNLYNHTKANEPYAQKVLSDGDILTCCLKENIISFKVNGTDYGKAYEVPCSSSSQQLYPVVLAHTLNSDLEIESK